MDEIFKNLLLQHVRPTTCVYVRKCIMPHYRRPHELWIFVYGTAGILFIKDRNILIQDFKYYNHHRNKFQKGRSCEKSRQDLRPYQFAKNVIALNISVIRGGARGGYCPPLYRIQTSKAGIRQLKINVYNSSYINTIIAI